MGGSEYARSIAFIIAACALLVGCGQSGPLTLPEGTGNDAVQSDTATQDDEQEEEEEQE